MEHLDQLELNARRGNSYHKLIFLIELEKKNPEYFIETNAISRAVFHSTFGEFSTVVGYEIYAIFKNSRLKNQLCVLALTKRRNVPFRLLETSRIKFDNVSPVDVVAIWTKMSREIPRRTNQLDTDFRDFETFVGEIQAIEESDVMRTLIDKNMRRKQIIEFLFLTGIEHYRYRRNFVEKLSNKLERYTTERLKLEFDEYKRKKN